ncbi:hypothetical protein AB5J49_08180 [Streptomyces sp. R28]|uniref:Uncharacterized protein n=1 Tax=Streptomyces sp. R28 TaxID=3238628 RepID=A0AB39PRD4_9ACTN
MTPAQISAVTNGLINVHAAIDTWWPALVGLAIAVGGTWLAFRCARFLGATDRLPGAPDNQAGTNTDNLRDTGEEKQP